MAVSPHLEGVVYDDAGDVSDYFVEVDGGEEGEVGHIVELDEETNHDEGVHGPGEQRKTELSYPVGNAPVQKGLSKGEEGS